MHWKEAQPRLRQLIRHGDPLGLADLAPDDEYDHLVLPLLGRLHHGADRPAISAYLRERVGPDIDDRELDAVADRLVTWWTDGAPAVTDQDAPTPCPACGAGVDQSSDPQRLFSSVCYCGHPRYYDDRHRDGSCPCQAPSR